MTNDDDPFRVRASSWGSLFNCAYQWEGVHILGMKSPSSPRATLGTAIHASTAEYDLGRLNGLDMDVTETAYTFIEALRNPEYDVDWRNSDLSLKEAEKIGITLHSMYCTQVAPKYEYIAVELETKPMVIDCGGGVKIQLTGTLDRTRITKCGAGIGIADLKTGAASVSQGKAKTAAHRPQIGTYELLYEHTTGTRCTAPGEIIGLKTKGKAEYGTGQVIGARDLMVGVEPSEDSDGYAGLIKIGADMFRAGLFPPNTQSFTCSERYCPRWSKCHYHE